MDELLPRPNANDAGSHANRTAGRSNPDSKHHDGVTLTDWLRLTSASSPGSEVSTSPSKPSATDAPVRSSGTTPATPSSSDGGRLFPDGETPTTSALLPTPNAADSWTPERASENTMRRGDPNGPLRNTSGSLVKDMARLTSSSEASPASQPAPLADARAPRTIAGSGPSSLVWLGSWDRATSSWRTSQVSLLSTEDERFPRSWETWPRSGMTRHGQAFALPTSAPPIGGSGSSLLRTPTANELNPGAGGELRAEITLGADRRNGTGIDSRGRPNLGRTLPTPAARDHKDGAGTTWHPEKVKLPHTIGDLLPTPNAYDSERGPDPKKGTRPGNGGDDLQTAIYRHRSLGDHTPPPSDDGNES